MKLLFRLSIAYLLGILCAINMVSPLSANELKVASKKFTESVILGEIVKTVIETSGKTVKHQRELGGTRIIWNALLAGEIDIYPEYSGTILREILASENIANMEDMKKALAKRNIGVTGTLGFNNTYALGIRKDLQKELGLHAISDLKRHPDLVLGFGNEFMDRSDGWPGLKKHYQLPQHNVRGLDHDLAYRGLESGRLQVIDIYTTDAEVTYYDIFTLDDDKNFFPVYNALILYRLDLVQRAPEAIKLLHQLAGKIDDTQMVAMNAQVKLEKQSESQVAVQFIKREFDVSATVVEESMWTQFLRYTGEHLFLVAVSLSLAILVAIPLGIYAVFSPAMAPYILGTVSVLQTIPSLALFVFMIPFLGIGGPPAIMALFLYSLLPIVRNTYTGLTSIPTSIRESAEVLGLPRHVQLIRIDLPLSLRTILAGIKTSAVINVGTATLAALIGAGGYGQPILTGIRLDDTMLILQGAVPAALLALLVQASFSLVEMSVVPRGIRENTESIR